MAPIGSPVSSPSGGPTHPPSRCGPIGRPRRAERVHPHDAARGMAHGAAPGGSRRRRRRDPGRVRTGVAFAPRVPRRVVGPYLAVVDRPPGVCRRSTPPVPATACSAHGSRRNLRRHFTSDAAARRELAGPCRRAPTGSPRGLRPHPDPGLRVRRSRGDRGGPRWDDPFSGRSGARSARRRGAGLRSRLEAIVEPGANGPGTSRRFASD